MRTIKFRQWHAVHKMMYDHKTIPVLLKNVADDNVYKYMQFTGLFDKNGKEIYDGDVIRTYMGNVCEIQWGHVLEKRGQEVFEYTGFCFHHIKQDKNYHLDVTTSCEIIGNIYQNPELLEK
jgi:uncharacterized phage protein (TIGR01671 family)